VNAAHLWHPWLRINRVLRAMLHNRWSAGVVAGPCRVQASTFAAECDPARRVVQLNVLDQRDRPVTSSGREADAMRRNSR
jgi:hypothetical protein